MDAAKSAEKDKETQVIRIWDDPESRINFLETVLKDKEWEAIVYHPVNTQSGEPLSDTPLAELAQNLKERGYQTQLGEDENRTPMLKIHKFSSDAELADAVKGMGFTKGIALKLSNVGQPLGNIVNKAAGVVKYALSDSARFLSSIYLINDLTLMFAGKDSDKLKTLAGVAAVMQSLVFIGFAKNGEESATANLNKIAQHAPKKGQDLFNSSTWQYKEAQRKGIIGAAHGLLKDHPIQIGSFAQIAGQVAFMAAGCRSIAKKGHNSGAYMDITTGALSSLAWLLVAKNPKKVPDEEKVEWSNPKRIWQEISENPNKAASVILFTNSLTGMAGGILENKPDFAPDTKLLDKFKAAYKTGNKPQIFAYGGYLTADAAMYVTESDHYGIAGANKAEMLSNAAEEFIKASPLVMGKEAENKLVDLVSDYLAEHSIQSESKKTKRSPQAGEVEALKQSISLNLAAKLPMVHERTNEVAGKIAGIVKELGQQEGEAAIDSLCEVICKIDGVVIEKEELKSHVARQVEYPTEKSTKPVTVFKLQKPFLELVESIPAAANAEIADKLYNAVKPHTQTEFDVDIKSLKQPQPAIGSHTAALAAQQSGRNELSRT